MSARLREALREVADAAPRIDVRPGLFDRARRSRRRRRAVTTAAVLVVVVGIVLGLGTVPPAPRPDRSSGPVDGGLPSLVVSPPRWTADVRSAPVGTGLVVYSGPESQEGLSGDSYPLVVVGPGDQYRTYDRPEWTSASTWSPTFLLSPDGRYLLMADIPSGSTSYSRLLDLRTGAVGILTAGAPLAWSPDGRQAVLVSYAGDATRSDP